MEDAELKIKKMRFMLNSLQAPAFDDMIKREIKEKDLSDKDVANIQFKRFLTISALPGIITIEEKKIKHNK